MSLYHPELVVSDSSDSDGSEGINSGMTTNPIEREDESLPELVSSVSSNSDGSKGSDIIN